MAELITKADMAYAMRQAAGAIQARGHAKNVVEDDEGQLCLYGALLLVTTGSPRGLFDHPDKMDLANACEAELSGELERQGKVEGARYTSIEWNNAPERTGEEVITFLLSNADRLSQPEKELTHA